MLRSDHVIPFVAGVGVATLLVAGIAFALPSPPPDGSAEVVIEQAAVAEADAAPVRVDEPEPVVAMETTVLAMGPLSAIEAGMAPPKTRVTQVEPKPVEEGVEQAQGVDVAAKPKVEAEQPQKKQESVTTEKKQEKPETEKTHEEKKQDEKEHEKKPDAWWPQAHGNVTACHGAGDAATVDWDVKLWGGSGWELVSAGGASETKPLGDGNQLLRYAGSSGDHWADHHKMRVASTIVVAPSDGGKHKEIHAEAWAYLNTC